MLKKGEYMTKINPLGNSGNSNNNKSKVVKNDSMKESLFTKLDKKKAGYYMMLRKIRQTGGYLKMILYIPD